MLKVKVTIYVYDICNCILCMYFHQQMHYYINKCTLVNRCHCIKCGGSYHGQIARYIRWAEIYAHWLRQILVVNLAIQLILEIRIQPKIIFTACADLHIATNYALSRDCEWVRQVSSWIYMNKCHGYWCAPCRHWP